MTLVDDGRVETGGLSFLPHHPCLLQNPDIYSLARNLSHTDEQTCKALATYLMREILKSLGLMTKMMSPTLTPSVAVSNRA